MDSDSTAQLGDDRQPSNGDMPDDEERAQNAIDAALKVIALIAFSY